MRWDPIADQRPNGEVLIYASGEFYFAVLVHGAADDPEPAFMDPGSADLIPRPSHWMKLPDPP